MEPLLLGLSMGLVCLASCGAVLVPWLVVQQRSLARTGRLIAFVLVGRFVGYLLFAVLAWSFGALLAPSNQHARAVMFGVAHVALAILLGWYVARGLSAHVTSGRAAHAGSVRAGLKSSTLPMVGPAGQTMRMLMRPRLRQSSLGPVLLGLLTGLNVCPPFIAAAVRAAELRSLSQAVVFFTVMFVGTSAWFLPLVAMGAARRLPESAVVARTAMALVAAYYAYTGVFTLYGSLLYG